MIMLILDSCVMALAACGKRPFFQYRACSYRYRHVDSRTIVPLRCVSCLVDCLTEALKPVMVSPALEQCTDALPAR